MTIATLNRFFLFAGLLGLAAIPPAAAEPAREGPIVVEAPWSRATPPGARVGVGYLTITNEGGEADVLLSASSPRVPSVEIHSMSITNEVMEMAELTDGLPIPANGEVALAPGGYHLMLIDLDEPLAEGESVPVTLVFERAGEVEAVLAVGPLGARGPAGDAHGAHRAH